MLMPQIHRGTLTPIKVYGKVIELDYSSSEIQFAELIDKLYAIISVQAAVLYNRQEELYRYLNQKVSLNETGLTGEDTMWISRMADFYRKYVIVIEVLPPDLQR